MTTQNKNLRLIFMAAICFVLFLSIFAYIKINSLIKSAASVNHTTQVTLSLEKVIGNMKDAETGQRGYLLTHDKKFLESFTNGLKEYPQNIKFVKQLTIHNWEQQKSLSSIEILARHRENYMRQMLDVDKLRKPIPEELLFGQAIMDSLRNEINTMIGRENKLMETTNKDLGRQTMRAPAMFLTLSLVALALVCIAYWRLNKALINAQLITQELKKKNIEIEKNKLIEANAKELQLILNKAPVAICVLRGANYVVEVANEKQLELWGKTKEEVINLPVFTGIPEGAGQGFEEMLGGVFKTGNPFFANELPIKLIRNGKAEIVYTNFVYQPLYNREHAIDAIISVATNVTEQVIARKKIEESEQLFEAAIAAVKGVVWTNNEKGEMEGVQPGWASLTGQLYEDYQGYGWANALHPDDAQSTIDAWNEAIDKRKPFVFEHRIKTKSGQWRNFSIRAIPVVNVDGSLRQWVGIHTDITEQKEAIEKIKESEERFRNLAQTLPQLVWVTDAQGNAEFASVRWREYSGIEPGGEKEWEAIVHPDDYEKINAAWIDSLKTGNIYFAEVRLKNKDGQYKWHTVRGEPVLNKENKIVKWVGAFTDINERKVQEERKDEFISIASHELKTPVTTVKGYLQLLELSLDDRNVDAKLYIKKASQSVSRLNELISELLDVSKIRLGKLQYNISTFNLNELVENTIENIQLILPTHTILLSGKVYNEVMGDKYRLQQVIINLLTNAVKYSPGANKVFINVEQQTDIIKVTVKDMGIGIAKHSLDKVFNKYHRVEEHAANFQGLGIGLFISYEIIQRHQGKIWVESEPGKGSAFHFTMPLSYSCKYKEVIESRL